MSQKVIVLELSDDNYATMHFGEPSLPSVEEVADIARDYDLKGNITCLYDWYEIGDGESGADEFFDDDEIQDMYDNGKSFEKEVESKGYVCELIDSGIMYSYVVDESEDDDYE